MHVALSKSLSVITHILIELVYSSCYLPTIECTRFKLQWDIERHGLEVHFVAVHYQRRMWHSEISSIIVVRFTTNRVILTLDLYLMVKLFTLGSIRSSPPMFSFGTICFIRFLESSYLVSFIFPHLHDL